MRPVKLVIRAFGPYANEQVVDFRQLADRSLFLIHGATGSGKTTILDAISFALFGVCSGGDKEARRIRSDHADSSVLTEVTFDFLLRSRNYRVYRMPEQNRPKKKGEGVTIARADAGLWDRTAALTDSDEGKLLATQWNNVTEAVEDLLGFRSSQFRQVVILPQGKFQEFLDADSKERQAILEVLFQTELYRRIEDALKQSAKDLESKVHDKKQHVRFVLEQAESESAVELGAKIEVTASEWSVNQGNLERLKTLEKEAREKLAEGRRTVEKLDELRRAQESLSALERRVREFEDKRATLGRARKAVALVAEEIALEKRSQEAEQASELLRTAGQSLERARMAKEQAEKNFAAERTRQQDRDQARRDLTRLEELGPSVIELDAVVKKLSLTEKEAGLAAKEFEETTELCVDLSSRIDAARRMREQNEKTALQTEILHVRFQEAERALRGLQRLENLKREETEALAELAIAGGRVQEAEQSLESRQLELKILESAWIEGQAAILAASLFPGHACPVCGSIDHPSPARADHPLPDEKALKTKHKEVEKLRGAADMLRREKVLAEKKAHEIRARSEALTETLNEDLTKPLPELEAEIDRTRKQLAEAKEAAKRMVALEEELAELEACFAVAQKNQRSAKERYDQAVSARQRVQTEVETRRSTIPEDLRVISVLKRETKRAREQVALLDAAMEQAQQDFGKANEELSAREAALRAAQDVVAMAGERALAHREQFAKSIREVGFVDRDDFRASRLTMSEIEQLEKEIQQFDSALSGAADRAGRAGESAKDLTTPDLAVLESTADSARSQLDAALKETAALEGRITRLTALLADHDKSARQMESLEAEYAVVGRISEVAGGRNREGITFQRFVLAALLDDVLRTASKRLRTMTNGRFSLQRVTDRTDRRTPGGLDLEVYDTYTGTARPVSTLSGGESFVASLSLALGLADVVQTYAGGIQLDTIFVDEGFGSLDPEVLDLAFRALVDLQQDGRLVGIISHVPELRERIDVRLEVTGDRVGSKARFVLG